MKSRTLEEFLLLSVQGEMSLQAIRLGNGRFYYRVWCFTKDGRDVMGTGDTLAEALQRAMASGTHEGTCSRRRLLASGVYSSAPPSP